jgi:protein-S-isoprenylcysteine O-methyltransferase Ste14
MQNDHPGAGRRWAVLLFAAVCYVLALGTFCYLIGFVADLIVPRSVSHGPAATWSVALPVDLALIALFGIQHSGMARAGFKARLRRIAPPALHRSLFVLTTTVVLWVIFLAWRPIPAALWDASGTPLGHALRATELTGWIVTLIAVRLIDDKELFGLRQALAYFRGREPRPLPMVTPSLYRFVRHPIYVGFLVAFWAAPAMTAGRLLFAAGMTVYILIGIRFEERDLIRSFGDRYRAYRQRVGMLVPRLTGARARAESGPAQPEDPGR